MKKTASLFTLSKSDAQWIWLHAQRLTERSPFGKGASGAQLAIEHLAYVQIDTISVIERAHHHILWSRVPTYRTSDLHTLQSVEKTVFEYWTHALAYLPVSAFCHYVNDMNASKKNPSAWYSGVTTPEAKKLLKRIRDQGPLSIRDIKDDILVDKDHEWASKKPSKRVLQYLFHAGEVVISKREGMLKEDDHPSAST